MDKIILVDGVRYHAEKASDPRPYVVIRATSAGAFFGRLEKKEGDTVTLSASRRLWYWSGANSLSELATLGVKNPKECKFPVALDTHEILGVCEIIHATDAAKKSIDAVPVWSA